MGVLDVTGMVQLAPLPGAVLLPAQGCSGAPVFNALGDVVGMVAQVFSTTPPMALAVPVDRLFASCPGLPGRERHLVRRQTAGTVRVDRGLSGRT